MSAIALVVALTTHTSAVNTKSSLESNGHTVTFVDDEDIGTTDFTVYDCVVACRLTNSQAVADGIRDILDDDKVPVAVGFVWAGAIHSGSQNGITTKMYLTGLMEIVSTSYGPYRRLDIIDNTHEITDAWSTGEQAVYVGVNYWGAVNLGDGWAGTKLCEGQAVGGHIANQAETIAIEANTDDLQGTPVPTGARCVLAGALWGGNNDYLAFGDDWLESIVQWLIPPVEAGLVVVTSLNDIA